MIAALVLIAAGSVSVAALIRQGTEKLGAQSVGGVPLYVNMLGSGNRYSLGRYVNGEPDPVGSIATSRCGLWSPSVTKARGRFWLYAAESDCRQWRRIILFKSRDGVHFKRYGPVIRRGHGEGELRMPYVVFDHGLFRAWYTVDTGPRLGQSLRYAESRDGTHFRSFPGARARAGGIDRGAMTVEMVFRMPHRGGWRLLYTAFDGSLTRARPALMTFGDPRQRHYGEARLDRRLARSADDPDDRCISGGSATARRGFPLRAQAIP